MENPLHASETQPRTCPNCGASVSSRAKTCLICGAELTPSGSITAPKLDALAAAQPAPRRASWRLMAIIVGVIVLALAGGGIWLRSRARVASVPSATPAPVPTATETPLPTETLTPSPPTHTPTPSPAPTQANTPVPPTRYTVRAGDTLASIAERYNTTVERIQQFNGLPNDVIQVGQVLQIPLSGSTPGPTTTPKPTNTFVPGPTPGTVLHVIQTGDTLLGISLKYGVPLNVIQTANNIKDAETIRVGDQLVIPIGPQVTATPGASPTPTGQPTYPAPALLSPLNDETFEGNDEPILLQWASVGILRQNEYYQVSLEHLGAGLVRLFRTRATGLHIPVDLFPKLDDTRRVFRWQVRVVRETGAHPDGTAMYQDAGLPGVMRTFRWVIARPTPTPTPGPTQ